MFNSTGAEGSAAVRHGEGAGGGTDDRAWDAVVVGAGYIGLEVAEGLLERGLEVTVVERLDAPMAAVLDVPFQTPPPLLARLSAMRLSLVYM